MTRIPAANLSRLIQLTENMKVGMTLLNRELQAIEHEDCPTRRRPAFEEMDYGDEYDGPPIVWTTASGEDVEIKLMDEDHLNNIISMLERRQKRFNLRIKIAEENGIDIDSDNTIAFPLKKNSEANNWWLETLTIERERREHNCD